MRLVKVFLATLAIGMTISTSSAFAWSCLAVSRVNGGEGWSYNYGSRGGAIERALAECGRYGPLCHIVRCQRNG